MIVPLCHRVTRLGTRRTVENVLSIGFIVASDPTPTEHQLAIDRVAAHDVAPKN